MAKELKGKADFTRIRGLSPIRDAEMNVAIQEWGPNGLVGGHRMRQELVDQRGREA